MTEAVAAGPVVLPLAGDGVSFATPADLVRWRSDAGALQPGHPDLVTVAVGIRSGDFAVGDHSGRTVRCDGRALAVALAAIPLYGVDVRLWLAWPDARRERRRLRRSLVEFAAVTGAAVWAPAEGARAEIRDGRHDLFVVGSDGEPGRWQQYGDGPPSRFESDGDGRLVPAASVVPTAHAGVQAVSVRPASVRPASVPSASVPPASVEAGDVPAVDSSSASVEAAGVPAVGVPPAGLLSVRRVSPSRLIDGPRLDRAAHDVPWHGLPWLPARPQVNQEECELFVGCAVDPDRAAEEGIPTPYLFLVGHLDRDWLAARTSDDYLLRVRVDPGGAVDVAESGVRPPELVTTALDEPDGYLLPAGWLYRSRLVAGYRVSPGVPLTGERRLDAVVALRSAGAPHGVPGVPNEVARWPHGRAGAAVTRFITTHHDAPDGLGRWQRLHRTRTDPVPGQSLLAVRVARRRAIDVAASLVALSQLPAVRTSLPQLSGDGVDHLLPAVSYPTVTVLREYRCQEGEWRQVKLTGRPTLDIWSPTQLP